MKRKEKLSLVKSIIIQYLINGLAWFVYAFSLLFENLPCKIIAAVSMLVAVSCSVISIFSKKEPEDEMSNVHMIKSKAVVCDLVYTATLIFTLLIPANVTFSIPIKFMSPLLLGIIQIVIGFMFVYYEKVGD